ncbi:hypothetical protein ACO22_07979 [Paracoccidioides brasiliensis]|uniref:Peptidase A2 domain-containing protein n=1 Tax=Paracoccidioides brasiliensis TaxID=121759 RepID=A0A1D2J369_PARBR|nr:hypothetical protein ACO22_07979 [Paracoccidioides brasiliensis]
MKDLIGGKSFNVPIKLAHNGIATSTNSLVDTGANELARFFNRKFQELPFKCCMKGYNGASGRVIDRTLTLNLWVDGQRFRNVPLLVTDLGQHSVILGQKWLAAQDIWLDVKNQHLVWLSEWSISEQMVELMLKIVLQSILKCPDPKPEHQTDAK